MSQLPPGSRQPLQTYLGSSVRPVTSTAAAAPGSVAPPSAAAVSHADSTTGAAAGPATTDLFATSAPTNPSSATPASASGAAAPLSSSVSTNDGHDIFSTPSSLFSAAPPSAAGVNLLHSLTETSPASTPRTSVFGESTFSITTPAQQQQQQPSTAPRVSNAGLTSSSSFNSPAQPSSLNTTVVGGASPFPASNVNSTFASPQPTSSLTSPVVPSTVKLDPTTDHPLLGGLPMPPPAALNAPLTTNVGTNNPLYASPGYPPTRPNPLQPAPAVPYSSSNPNSANPAAAAGAPNRMIRSSSTGTTSTSTAPVGAFPNPLQQQQLLNQSPPGGLAPQSGPAVNLAAAGVSEGPSSPDEKLSTMLAELFKGTPPPTKLAQFDVSTVPRTEDGLVQLAEKGCWRELIHSAETMLEIKDGELKRTPAAMAAAAAANTTSQPTSADTVSPIAFHMEPHKFFRLLHYYFIALLKMKKNDVISSMIQQTRLNNLFHQDKLFVSYPNFYPNASNATEKEFIGNLLPFELMLFVSEFPHHNVQSSAKTRHALDQLMKLYQWKSTQIQRKKQPAAAAAANTQHPHHQPHEKRTSVSEGPNAALSANPFTLASTHTLSPLTLEELQHQFVTVRSHILNLCVSFHSSLDMDYEQAILWLEELLREDETNPELNEAMARLQLQLGDAAQAQRYMQRAKSIYEDRGEKENTQIGLHQVFFHLSRNDYPSAYEVMSKLFQADPHSVEIANNYAVCCLYTNRIQQAVAALEDLIRKDPLNNLTEAVVSNLRALYDLSSSNPTLKRKVLEGLVLQYASDELDQLVQQ